MTEESPKTLPQILAAVEAGYAQLHAAVLRQGSNVDRLAASTVARDNASSALAIAAAKLQVAAAELRLWTGSQNQDAVARHQILMSAMAQTTSLHREAEAVALPVEGPRAKLALRIILILISMASAWVAGAGVGAEHGAEQIIKAVRGE